MITLPKGWYGNEHTAVMVRQGQVVANKFADLPSNTAAVFWFGLAAAILFSVLPVLLRGYTYPPGDDPATLEFRLTWAFHAYYGQFPAKVIGMAAYYYLTPALTYLGLWVLLRRYGTPTILLTWAALWLICRTLLFDLHAGTFVGVINLYLLGSVLLRLLDLRHWAAVLLGAAIVPFHGFTGMVVMSGITSFLGLGFLGDAFRRPWLPNKGVIVVVVGLLLGGIGLAWRVFDAASVYLPMSALVNGDMPNSALVDHSGVSFARFMREYLGVGLISYWGWAAIVVGYAWDGGWRPKVDGAMLIIGFMAFYLGIMSIPIMSVNADRTLKLMAGLVTVLATVGIMRGAKGGWGMASVLVIAGCFAVSAPDNLAYWLLSGSYR